MFKKEAGFENVLELFPANFNLKQVQSEFSGKMAVLDMLLASIKHQTTYRVVLVSNYTQTLDMFTKLCEMCRYPHVRLDGSKNC